MSSRHPYEWYGLTNTVLMRLLRLDLGQHHKSTDCNHGIVNLLYSCITTARLLGTGN
jgi:hypothetical protein